MAQIKRTDVRVGNFVKASYWSDLEDMKDCLEGQILNVSEWEIAKIKGIYPNLENCIYEYEFYLDGMENDEVHRIEGIEITREWLLKMGFKESEKDYFVFDFELNNKYSNNHHAQFEYYLEGSIYDIKFNFVFENIAINYIKHVHQVQNFFYSLTGKELEIKES